MGGNGEKVVQLSKRTTKKKEKKKKKKGKAV
jgi:hypothetical protein